MSTAQELTPICLNITLDARALKAASLGCIQKDNDQPFRYAMHCVALDITTHNVVAVGLSGHKMIAASAGQGLPDIKPQTLLIPRKIIDKIKLGISLNCTLRLEGFQDENGVFITGTVKGLKGTLSYDGMSVEFTFQCEVFPDWRQICPATATGEAADYDTAIVDSVQKAYSLFFDKKKGHYVKILHNGNAPARVVFENVDAFAVIMPLRLDIPLDTPLPAWAVK